MAFNLELKRLLSTIRLRYKYILNSKVMIMIIITISGVLTSPSHCLLNATDPHSVALFFPLLKYGICYVQPTWFYNDYGCQPFTCCRLFGDNTIYARTASPCLANRIVLLLQYLATHPELPLTSASKELYLNLLDYWQQVNREPRLRHQQELALVFH